MWSCFRKIHDSGHIKGKGGLLGHLWDRLVCLVTHVWSSCTMEEQVRQASLEQESFLVPLIYCNPCLGLGSSENTGEHSLCPLVPSVCGNGLLMSLRVSTFELLPFLVLPQGQEELDCQFRRLFGPLKFDYRDPDFIEKVVSYLPTALRKGKDDFVDSFLAVYPAFATTRKVLVLITDKIM